MGWTMELVNFYTVLMRVDNGVDNEVF